MHKNTKFVGIFAIIALLLGLFAFWFFATHFFVGGKPYSKNADILDLQGKALTVEEFGELTARLPDTDILWDVPFQGQSHSSQTQELTVTTLEDADLPMLKYFTELQSINAENCTDYPQLAAAAGEYPHVDIRYFVTIDGQSYPKDTESLTISHITDEEVALLQYLPQLTAIDATGCTELDPVLKIREAHPACEVTYTVSIGDSAFPADISELTLNDAEPRVVLENLKYLPNVTNVTLMNPSADGESLSALPEQYPDITFYWEMDVMGVRVTSNDPEVDLSEAAIESVEAVETAMTCFPNAEKVYLGECGIDNDVLAAYRDRVRKDYKVVWLLRLSLMPVRTDDTTFMPGRPSERYYIDDKHAELLRYCEDMICVDVGHYQIYHCDWAKNMPKLKYLILSDTLVADVSPLADLKELVFLEMFGSLATDYSPLTQLTSLEDLNLCLAEGKDPEPIKQMTWLKRLWWNNGPLSEEELQKALPNTEVKCRLGSSTGHGWREGQNYYDMRDLLEMPYYVW